MTAQDPGWGPLDARASSGSLRLRPALLCLAIALAAGALAYGAGRLLPFTYQSSGLIRVALPSQQGIIDPVVTAANDTATQYAQLASSQPVQAMAARRLGVSAKSLDGKINGGTSGAQNLVQVTVTSSSRNGATAGAAAASAALAQYISGLNLQAGAQYQAEVQRGLAKANRDLGLLAARIVKESAAARATDNVLMQSLSFQRDQLLGQIARDAASNRPSLQVVNTATPATVVSPKPTLYAAVAFVVALLLAARVAFVLDGRRRA